MNVCWGFFALGCLVGLAFGYQVGRIRQNIHIRRLFMQPLGRTYCRPTCADFAAMTTAERN